MREARYQDDMREGLELRIQLDDQGDVYVSVLPVGHKLGPTVRLCASGGAASLAPGLLPAMRAAHRAILDGRNVERHRLPAALLDVALYDATAKAAVEAIRHGADPVETLAAAVVVLAEWKREWSPEAMRAMMLRPPAPLHICCVGKHGDSVEPACDCAVRGIACVHGRAFGRAKLAGQPLVSASPVDADAALVERIALAWREFRGLGVDGFRDVVVGRPAQADQVEGPLSREAAIKACARAGAAAAEEIGLHGYQGRADDEQAAKVLAGNTHLVHRHFIRAVLAEARRLVASGECPELANEPALRGGA